QRGLGLRSVLHGSGTLALAFVLVGGFSVFDSYTTPTILQNPITQQLPPNVTFYAALNIQQVFLENTRRPLDAVVNLLNSMSAGQPAALNAGASPQPPAGSPPATAESPTYNL